MKEFELVSTDSFDRIIDDLKKELEEYMSTKKREVGYLKIISPSYSNRKKVVDALIKFLNTLGDKGKLESQDYPGASVVIEKLAELSGKIKMSFADKIVKLLTKSEKRLKNIIDSHNDKIKKLVDCKLSSNQNEKLVLEKNFLESECNKFKKLINSFEEGKKEKDEKIKILNSNIEELNIIINQKDNEINELKINSEIKDKKIKILEEEVKIRDEKIRNLDDKFNLFMKEIKENIQELKSEGETKDKKIKQLEENIITISNLVVIPNDFYCGIGLYVMTDPVMGSDGKFYERCEIEKWLEKNQTSPFTGEKMTKEELKTSYSLNGSIEQLMNNYGRIPILDSKIKSDYDFYIMRKESEKLRKMISSKEYEGYEFELTKTEKELKIKFSGKFDNSVVGNLSNIQKQLEQVLKNSKLGEYKVIKFEDSKTMIITASDDVLKTIAEILQNSVSREPKMKFVSMLFSNKNEDNIEEVNESSRVTCQIQ